MGQANGDQIIADSDWQQTPAIAGDSGPSFTDTRSNGGNKNGGPKRNPCSITGWYKSTSRKDRKNRCAETSRSGSSSFLAGTVAATDQVLLKLVQRLASLRSGGSNTNNCKKNSKTTKKQTRSDSNSSATTTTTNSSNSNSIGGENKCAISSSLPPPTRQDSGSEVPSKKLRCHRDTACHSGNYHAQFAARLVEDEYDNDDDEQAKSSGNEIKCISFTDLISDDHHQRPTSSPIPLDHPGSDCDLVPPVADVGPGCDDEADDDDDDEENLIRPTGINSGGVVRRYAESSSHLRVAAAARMGSNVSRHHEKGLTGRRAQSTDNLKSDQTPQSYQYHYINNNNTSNNNNLIGGIKSNVPPDLTTPGDDFTGLVNNLDDGSSTMLVCHPNGGGGGGGVGGCPNGHPSVAATLNGGIAPHDRNKFCGSLPNHLDADDACEAIFKQNEFLQTHLKNVLASHQQQQPEYVTMSSLAGTDQAVDAAAIVNRNQQQQQQQMQQLPPTYQQSSPFYSSSSGKGSTISSTALGSSTFRGCGAGERSSELGVGQLMLPLLRTATNNNSSNSTSSSTTTTTTTADAGCDQGYGSERSPEDELPPPLLLMHEAQYNEILASSQQQPVSAIEPNDLQRYWNYEKAAASLIASSEYSFITKESVFLVQVPKGTRGLGLSVSGGSDSTAPFPGLIRIKRLFPHQAAWATGMLQPGDILLESNGIPLSGLTNYEALEVLRTAPNYVTLTVCRPQDEQYRKLSPPSEPPKPPLRNAAVVPLASCGELQSHQLMQLQVEHQQQQQQQQQMMMMPHYYQQQQYYIYRPQTLDFAPYGAGATMEPGNFTGEFEIILTKQQGSLGFTLRKEDESILGHCVRALVRDPALNDGRIRPGDKIVAVNNVPISQMTHEEAVIFLRQAADVVKLRLFRDETLTPLSAQSPTMECPQGICSSASTSTVGHGSGRPKPNLRPEALNLLTDIAHRKQTATNSGDCSTSSSVKSSNASPRRLRRGLPQSQQSKRSYDNHGYQHSGGETTSNYSDSETSTIRSQASSYVHHQAQMVPVGVFHSTSCRSCGGTAVSTAPPQNLDELYYCDDEIDAESLYEHEGGEGQKRPNFLDLAGESGSTPMSSRKPRFQFSVATTNAYELNNLDNDALDAPTMYALNNGDSTAPPGASDQFISLPCETFLVACKTENDLNADSTDAIYVKHFAHKSPLYSSVHVPLKDTGTNASEVVDAVAKGGKISLMKWKGAILASDEDETPSQDGLTDGTPSSITTESGTLSSSDGTTLTRHTPEAESSLLATIGSTSTTTPTTERELESNGCGTDGDGNKIFTVELNKRWNSRLGFSLKQDPLTGRTVIRAIYSESVAAKDGRLRVGDQVIMVNDESVEAMTTAQIIDLLRIIRGSICLRLVRRQDPAAIPSHPPLVEVEEQTQPEKEEEEEQSKPSEPVEQVPETETPDQ
ncbi:uncharacterized protein LOC131688988 [Topomyia yanbarensis]|uniref:uncharacterized protein LOC131688988 n=1 Tax=Topomyia yanbarensis TaxID=2498891 RepID=UPI00273BAE16|nr:uncharacterized protein LOC131688988 [Topomyia yanbarensis]XP_058829693.1 uncharacterized protein LOC131688988 [Topomyia yanbarensis]